MRRALLLSFLPGPALACGGLFCSTGPSAAPVDQSAERILFEVDGDGICATVQIQYAGSPEAFAWVVPVPEPPTVEDGDQALLDALAQATALQWQLPGIETSDCFFANGGDEAAASCGCDDAAEAGASALPADGGVSPPESDVFVFDRQQTENYETVTIGAEQAADLVAWLDENAFNVSENMVPAMQPYADAGQVFLAIKLRTDRAAAQIAPIRFCYQAAAPSVPLRLTAVAAQPQMGVQVWVAAHTLYAPLGTPSGPPLAEELAFDDLGRVNYPAWVARGAARDGRWSLQFAGEAGVAPGLAAPWLTSWYTRLGPEQMQVDPVFTADFEVPDFSGLVDLSGRAPVMSCGGPIEARLPSSCAFVYCGPGATCVDFADGTAGCVCSAGQVALAVGDPDGSSHAVCAPAENPLGVTAEDGGDPCAAVDCGAGACVARGGFAACRCAEGSAAVATPGLGCVAIPMGARTFAEGAGADAGNHDEAVFQAPLRRRLGLGGLAFVGVLAWGLRRRRRASA
ncbi:MAG: DUF2330 domain-containing protein [bacterium]